MKQILLVALLLAIAPAQALSLSASAPGTYIDPMGSMDITVDVTVDCADIVSAGGSLDAALTAEVLDGVDVTGETVSFAVSDCSPPSSTVTKQGTVTLTPTDSAAGLTPFDAKIISGDEQTTVEGLAVDYKPGHTMSIEGDQTFEVTGGYIEFPLDLTITANAKTMIMFEEKSVSTGLLDGLAHKVFDVAANETSATYTVSWTAPEGGWENATVSFYTYSHCLDKTEGCDPQFESRPTWTFINMDPHGTETEGEKESPSFALPLLIVGLALVALRRR